jgi:diketogulonate reductase-like aldo/keto reductase
MVLFNKQIAHIDNHLIVDTLENAVPLYWKVLFVLLQKSVVDHHHLQLFVLLHHRVRFYSRLVIYIIVTVHMDEEPKKKRGLPIETLPDKQVFPMIGLGTYKLTDKKEVLEVLKAALLAGYRHFDTAISYQNEEALGLAIETCIGEGRCKREDLFIASKTSNHMDRHPVKELKEALARLNLKYVDLYYVHTPVSGLDGEGKWTHRQICDIWQDMEECVRRGYTRHLGISNFNGQNVLDILSYCKIKPIANQFEYHPYLQQHSLVDICQKNGIICVAYMPLGRPGRNEDVNIIKDELIQ